MQEHLTVLHEHKTQIISLEHTVSNIGGSNMALLTSAQKLKVLVEKVDDLEDR